jgi:hypothetical protein
VASADAVSLNLTATAATAQGNLRLYPTGAVTPLVSTLNFTAGVTRANNAVAALGTDGQISVLFSPSGATHVVLDVNGYFQDSTVPLECPLASVSGSGEATTEITFDEPAVAATRTHVYAEGSYTNCPDYYSDQLASFNVGDLTLQGAFAFRSNYNWGTCTSHRPDIYSGGTLQTSALDLSLTLPAQVSRLRLSLVTDGSHPDPAFQLDASAGGEQATVTATTSDTVGRFELSCTKPVDSVVLRHAGPYWVLDTLAF